MNHPDLSLCGNTDILFTPKNPVIVIPTHNEEHNIVKVLDSVAKYYNGDICIIDDGSCDKTPSILKKEESDSLHIITHDTNIGYGRALTTGFEFALTAGYDAVVTFDSDGQHDSTLIAEFLAKLSYADIVSGTRYGDRSHTGDTAPADRKRINMFITELLNKNFDFKISDSFCGYKAYRASALKKLQFSSSTYDFGYGFPLEVWIDAAAAKLDIAEIDVPRIYLDLNRSFGGSLDDPQKRLSYYLTTIDNALLRNFGYSLNELDPVHCCGGAS